MDRLQNKRDGSSPIHPLTIKETFCQWCGDYHATNSCRKKPVQNEPYPSSTAFRRNPGIPWYRAPFQGTFSYPPIAGIVPLSRKSAYRPGTLFLLQPLNGSLRLQIGVRISNPRNSVTSLPALVFHPNQVAGSHSPKIIQITVRHLCWVVCPLGCQALLSSTLSPAYLKITSAAVIDPNSTTIKPPAAALPTC